VAPRPRDTSARENLVLLLPGSRSHEIDHNLPIMLRVAERLRSLAPDIHLESAHLTERGRERVAATIDRQAPHLGIRVHADLYTALAGARLALVTSGTATVEVALMQTPPMVFYRVSRAALLLSRCLVTVPFIAQVNLIRGRRAFPEFVVVRPDITAIASQALDLYRDGAERERACSELAMLAAQMGGPGASERAALEGGTSQGVGPFVALGVLDILGAIWLWTVVRER
jgi:lipid-A-disaccharide synthase